MDGQQSGIGDEASINNINDEDHGPFKEKNSVCISFY